MVWHFCYFCFSNFLNAVYVTFFSNICVVYTMVVMSLTLLDWGINIEVAVHLTELCCSR